MGKLFRINELHETGQEIAWPRSKPDQEPKDFILPASRKLIADRFLVDRSFV